MIKKEKREVEYEKLYSLYEKYFDRFHIMDSTNYVLFMELMESASDKDKEIALNAYTNYYIELGRKMGYIDSLNDIKIFVQNKKEGCITC